MVALVTDNFVSTMLNKQFKQEITKSTCVQKGKFSVKLKIKLLAYPLKNDDCITRKLIVTDRH